MGAVLEAYSQIRRERFAVHDDVFAFSVNKPAVLIVVENLPVPLDRRVWQESCALRDAGYEVIVICPQMRGFVAPEEKLDGIQIYRHWISEEAGGFTGFFREYISALWGEWRLAWRAWRR